MPRLKAVTHHQDRADIRCIIHCSGPLRLSSPVTDDGPDLRHRSRNNAIDLDDCRQFMRAFPNGESRVVQGVKNRFCMITIHRIIDNMMI